MRERSGYVYQEINWYAVVTYKDNSGQPQTIRRRAKSQSHASELAEQIIEELKQTIGHSLKTSHKVISEKGAWIARVTLTDSTGKRKNVKRHAENKTEARELQKKLLRQIEDRGEQAIEGDRLTFDKLADVYEKHKAKPPEYHDERKVRGLRSYRNVLTHLKTLKAFFGRKLIRSITVADIEEYKSVRLKTKTCRVKEKREDGTIEYKARSLTSVNRELEVLRAMLQFAVRQNWLARSPFSLAESIISKADEKQRERILTRDEEEKLLAACTDQRAHLRPIIICALDTGMRQGEIFKLQWKDVDLANRTIIIQAFNTKTLTQREVGITDRLAQEFERLWELSPKDPEMIVFGIENNVKHSFLSVRKTAGLPDVRFHDLRHTHATRLVSAHIPLSEVGRILGHTQANTTYRYVNANVETARRAAAVLDEFNKSSRETKGKPAELVN